MPKQPLIVGNPVLVVVDMQECGDMPAELVGIAHMAGYDDRIARAQRLIAAARAAGIPIVFF
ncbi:isochorismatase family protein, partial [Mycobacterium sp. CBMA361]